MSSGRPCRDATPHAARANPYFSATVVTHSGLGFSPDLRNNSYAALQQAVGWRKGELDDAHAERFTQTVRGAEARRPGVRTRPHAGRLSRRALGRGVPAPEVRLAADVQS